MTISPLENSIREEAAHTIAAIKEKENLEISQMEETYAAEIDSFRKQAESDTEVQLQQEIFRLSNRAILERRKLELQSMEQFINRLVGKVMNEIRDNPNYKQFLLDAVLDAVGNISADFEVQLKPEDLALENDIRTSLAAAGINHNIVIKGDSTIRWGGCLIYDKAGGRIFNHTLERIYYRKSLIIQQRVVKILTDHESDKKKLSLTATEP